MKEIWQSLAVEVQSAIIAAITALTVFLIGGLTKFFHDRYSLNYKLRREHIFEQQKSIIKEIAKTKTPLLNAAEELNYRLWNFKNNITEGWHLIAEDEWLREERYYLRSTVYRFLIFHYFIYETEKAVLSLDPTIASPTEELYLKFIKTFKQVFCDILLLRELNYDNNATSNHFYRDEMIHHIKFLKTNDNRLLDYDEFFEKIKIDYTDIKRVFLYFNQITNDNQNKNLNVLRCFHLLLMRFLNEYGLDYQNTNKKKLNGIIKDYKHIAIKKGFCDFIERNKLNHQMKWILKNLNNAGR